MDIGKWEALCKALYIPSTNLDQPQETTAFPAEVVNFRVEREKGAGKGDRLLGQSDKGNMK